MKKVISIILAAAMLLSGCGDKESRLQHSRDDNVTVILRLPNGEVIEGCPDWLFVGDDIIRVQIDGVAYEVHKNNFAQILEVAE